MERIKKILFLFAIILTCVFGISGVKAENFSKTVTVTANNQTNEGWWIHPHVSLIKKTSDGKYVFCLDSGKQVDLNVPLNYNEKLYADKLESVNRIINKSISLGLGSSNQWGIPDTDFYGITQIAIWKAVHGEGAAGYTSIYKSWIGTRYSDVLNILFNAVNEPVAEPSISFQGTEGMSVDGNYLVSNEFKIVTSNVDPNAKITFSINDGEASINDIWVKGDFYIKSGDVIKFRVRKPSTGSGTISVSASVKTSEFNYGYDTYFYDAKTSGYQNIAAYYPRSTSVSDSITVSGSYENVEKKVGTVKISKKDYSNGSEVKGAHMQILDSNGKAVATWESTDKPYEVQLDIGKYTLVETLPAPNYGSDMTINDKRTSKYSFEITKDNITKIDVYNEMNVKIIDTPITGMSVSGLYFIGGLVTLAGASVVVYAKKKENV